ncbi:hypothetical protein [Sphingomonas sp.]|uniref:hypothetical protein n=1 Tax=Sphingomonas sp. TaxID=28214 RepID=UPI0031D22570
MSRKFATITLALGLFVSCSALAAAAQSNDVKPNTSTVRKQIDPATYQRMNCEQRWGSDLSWLDDATEVRLSLFYDLQGLSEEQRSVEIKRLEDSGIKRVHASEDRSDFSTEERPGKTLLVGDKQTLLRVVLRGPSANALMKEGCAGPPDFRLIRSVEFARVK